MSRRQSPGFLAVLVLAGLVLLAMAGCWNGPRRNETYVETGGRFALEIETGRSDVGGTHFLVDTVTGDLWRLDTRRAGAPIWVRIADGPPDAKPLDQIATRILAEEDAEE